MIDRIKELLKNEDIDETRFLLEDKNDKELKKYITFKAGKHLNNKTGGIDDKIVIGWAIHFYIEDKAVIDKEMKPVKVDRSIPKKELTPEELEIQKQKRKEQKALETKKRKAKELALSEKKEKLKKQLNKLRKEDPFRVHELDEKNLVIKSHEPKKNNEDQMGLFDL